MPLPVLVEQLCEDCRFCWWPLLRFITFHSSFNQNSIQLFCIRIASSRFPPVFGLFFLCEGTEQKKSSSERHTCIASSRFELRILQSSAVLKCYCDDFIRFLRSCVAFKCFHLWIVWPFPAGRRRHVCCEESFYNDSVIMKERTSWSHEDSLYSLFSRTEWFNMTTNHK